MKDPGPHSAAAALELSINASAGKNHAAYLRRNLRRAHALIGSRLRELSIALVGEKRMSDLHQRYLDHSGATDVLSFALETDARGRVLAGEIVLCVPEAQRQARKRRIPVRRELLLYGVHGLLHLCGYDDRTPAGYRAMHRKEDNLLRAMGIGATFAVDETGGEACC